MKLIIAKMIDRLFPRVCWADLVLWFMDIKPFREIDFTGACAVPPYCYSDGTCYCGKQKNTYPASLETLPEVLKTLAPQIDAAIEKELDNA